MTNTSDHPATVSSSEASVPAPPARPLPEGVQCVACGYSLCGLTVERDCPECGVAASTSMLQGLFLLEAVKRMRDHVMLWRVTFGLIVLGFAWFPVFAVLFRELKIDIIVFLVFTSWLLHTFNVATIGFLNGYLRERRGLRIALLTATILGPMMFIVPWTLDPSRISMARWPISCGLVFTGISFLLLEHVLIRAWLTAEPPLRSVSLPKYDRLVAVGLLIVAAANHFEIVEAFIDPVIGLTRVRYVPLATLAWVSAPFLVFVGSALQIIKLGRPLRHASRLVANTELVLGTGATR